MNWDQIYSLARDGVKGAGMTLVTHGYMTSGSLELAAGAIVTLIGIGLSMVFHRADGTSIVQPPK